MSTDFYEGGLRSLLFKLPPETAHRLGQAVLGRAFPWSRLGKGLAVQSDRLKTSIGGMSLENPIGLSAGFDKSATALPGLDHLGFGAITVGSILPNFRTGNPRPRLIRYPDKESMLNCYGLPSDGLAVALARLKQHALGVRKTPVIANIDAPDIESYLASFDAVQPFVDAIELGLQCPNNGDDDGALHVPKNFDILLREISRRRSKPVFAKIFSYSNEEERRNRFELVEIAVAHKIDGVVIPGNWRQKEQRLAMGMGTTSGRMTFDRALVNVRDIYAITRGKIGIKANGGIFSGEDAFKVLAAGANMIDLLTAFVYRGWAAAYKINSELEIILQRKGVRNLDEVRSSYLTAA